MSQPPADTTATTIVRQDPATRQASPPAEVSNAVVDSVAGGALRVQDNDDAAICERLFKGLVFFLGREVPREQLLFVIRAFGGVVAWQGEGSPLPESDESITHQVGSTIWLVFHMPAVHACQSEGATLNDYSFLELKRQSILSFAYASALSTCLLSYCCCDSRGPWELGTRLSKSSVGNAGTTLPTLSPFTNFSGTSSLLHVFHEVKQKLPYNPILYPTTHAFTYMRSLTLFSLPHAVIAINPLLSSPGTNTGT